MRQSLLCKEFNVINQIQIIYHYINKFKMFKITQTLTNVMVKLKLKTTVYNTGLLEMPPTNWLLCFFFR